MVLSVQENLSSMKLLLNLIFNSQSMTNTLINETKNTFKERFSAEPDYTFLSPGRINIIGEHVDYNDGYVLPAAIDKYICLAIKKSDSDESRIFSSDYNEDFSFKTNEDFPKEYPHWASYLLGVIQDLRKRNQSIQNFDLVFKGNIPIGAGLSSSAALECGFASVLNEMYQLNLSKKDIALIGKASENNFVGVNCGIMDQFASTFGQENKVIFLNCDTLDYQYFNAEVPGCHFILFDTCVKHTHLTSGYNDRREEMEKGKSIVKKHFPEISSFRDCTPEMLEQVKDEMGEVVYKRCLFVVEEIARVDKAVKALENQNLVEVGQLLLQTHKGLSELYEVSCKELDFLVEEAMKNDDVLGARMMGGGFGGCTINLIRDGKQEEIAKKVAKAYKEKFGIDMKVYQVNISESKIFCNENQI